MAADKSKDKTNAMRMLDAAKVEYRVEHYDPDLPLSGTEIANLLGQDTDQVFKTLVTVGKSGDHYVFMVPVEAELDLKKAAQVAGEKSIAMIKSKELLPLTGYVHGGCSPLGMKKLFPTFIDETVTLFDVFMCSAGRRGCQIQLTLEDLLKVIPVEVVDVTA
ncbi:Cys-tRNA(Pro) deacylase [Slackia heliotrinireducens]|uniref:Cys-tRNA(Pro)/Cys-tRNA(Cys) deacylase n=1 Tax=Slackia heliotrinireducens (strain ATCC 29202 / DSM 20476 / NCTC 11029 / RHS 1) TaxID=471855 RepID=C7N4R3_SLAHD|nr:Cys-tRNA(Pro) deacylase [Slackia heliotrinireducens]ACV21898.1 ybaK/ebsC protein [Slackia heliotrinireducens DSM 20476]VEG99694.1 Cys-tRNA(Pro)/Cys-tRNA(Cys) deacylase ybaK [Slackia heliotrinireducens]